MNLVNDTIGALLAERAFSMPDKAGLHYKGEMYTWQDIDDISNELCYELNSMGIQQNDPIGILGSNSAGWVFYYFALMKLGASAVLFSTRFKEIEIERGIRLTKVKGLIYSEGYKNESYASTLDHFREKQELSVQQYICMERPKEQWREAAKNGKIHSWKNSTDCCDVANILFTSGTTSSSKGVQLTHYNLVNNARAMVENMRWNQDDTMCIAVPLFHCFGVTACILTCLCTGAAMVVMGDFHTLEVCKYLEDYKCTILSGVPSMFLAMLKKPERVNYDISSVKSGIIAGSPIFAEEYIDICNMFDHIKLQTSYGQTETSPCISISAFEDSLECKSRTAGKPVEHVEVRICCLDSDQLCNFEEEGEIQVRGYNVMKGYISDTAEHAQVFTKDGWLKTGDVGCTTADGHLRVTGRCKNLIIRGGENISPLEIEHCIKEVAKNREIAVFGIPSAVLQEDIVACLEGGEDLLLEKAVRTHLKKNLSDYKIPKYLYFVDEIPRSGTGKIDEKILKEHILTLIDRKKQ